VLLSEYDWRVIKRVFNSAKETKMQITEQSKALFLAYAADAGNWSGTPLVGGNVGGSKEDRGNLTQLKRAKLITTWVDEGCTWLSFTDAGKAFANENGVQL
jgi:hypothetical protein